MNTSTDKTWSSSKIDAQFKDIAKQVENVGQPTQQQINTAIDKAIEEGRLTGSGGINSTAKTLLETILKNAIYTTDQSANITALMSALSNGSSGGDTPSATYYTVTNKLTKCTNGNSSSSVAKNTSYIATITPNTGHKLDTVTVTMGGADVTSTVYSNGNININSVTGNIVITATAIELTSTGMEGNLIDFNASGLNDENTSHTMPDSAQTNSEHHVTPYIPVDTTQTYYTNLTSKVDAEGTISEWNQKIYFYNSEKQYITVRKYDLNKLPTVKIKVDFPENTAYVRVYFHTGYTAIKPYFGLDSNNITV